MRRAMLPCLVLVVLTLAPRALLGAESPDVTISTPFPPGQHPKVADFYFNQLAVGSGEKAFEEILRRVRELPAGSSIVWGPNYARCGSCSGSEPDCLARGLYPKLWSQLEQVVKNRKLTLSSDFPGPFIRSVRRTYLLPKAISINNLPNDSSIAGTLEWEIGDELDWTRELPEGGIWVFGRLHRVSVQGKPLAEAEISAWFERLPPKSQIIVRLGALSATQEDDEKVVAKRIADGWEGLFWPHVASGKVAVLLAASEPIRQALLKQEDSPQLRISWQNYHGPQTTHDEVLYFVNDKFLGRGDKGFKRLLDQVERAPKDHIVNIPQYAIGGRIAYENLGLEKVQLFNSRLKGLTPFRFRWAEFQQTLDTRSLEFHEVYLPMSFKNGSVLDWSSGDRNANFPASFGKIGHHSEQANQSAARIGWTDYDAVRFREDDKRALETTAVYTLDDVKVGPGVTAFAEIMERIARLPEQSVVQVRVCLRARGPFTCPIIYQGKRHFERTGFEPYFGMFGWLVDVTQEHKLKIEWLPDEEKSCENCSLNR